MAAIQGAISAAERSMRSVFVGNIPYEATEEQLKDIFSEVGPVVSFRLVYDRETGKPKGYGFCEYKDQETALSAMRNLNGYELNGRALRVDNAASEKSKEELKSLQASLGGPPAESPYGPEVDASEAPESISKAVASLPPEQMFELMKQMKLCIQNNPNEARNMLLQNPQLAYALLQAQVIMRIIDPQVALSILHRQNINTTSLLPTPEKDIQQSSAPATMVSNTQPAITSQMNSFNHQQPVPPVSDVNSHVGFRDTTYVSPMHGQYGAAQAPGSVPNTMIRSAAPVSRPSLLGDRPTMTNEAPRSSILPQFPEPRAPDTFDPRLDPRNLGDRDMRQGLGDRDMRQPPITDRDMRPSLGDQDLRHLSPARTAADGRVPYDPRFRNIPPEPHRAVGTSAPFDPRIGARSAAVEQRSPFEGVRTLPGAQVRFEDPRAVPTMPSSAPLGPRPAPPATRPMPVSVAPTPTPAVQPAAQVAAQAAPRLPAASQPSVSTPDQEKAALIMQVLQLSDQQIAMLPPEQRQSIMILKEQIARSTQH